MACRFCDYEKMKEAIVYSDETVYAALSNVPLSYGHILIVPRRHIDRLEELSVDEIVTLFCVVKNLLPKLLKAVNASDYNLFINAGPAANQNVFHLHIHIIPRGAHRSRLDVFFSAFNSKKSCRLSKSALAKTTSLIRKQISQLASRSSYNESWRETRSFDDPLSLLKPFLTRPSSLNPKRFKRSIAAILSSEGSAIITLMPFSFA